MFPALYYVQKDKDTIKCQLCPHGCVIGNEKTGICRVRKNHSGKLFSLTYDKFTSINLDPIEKKPLYHFHPGTYILSVGTIGCNFACDFCQNWEISQASFNGIQTRTLTKEFALKYAIENNSIGIAYTYNEPLMNYEWVLDTSKLFKEKGLKNVLVSNGFINEEPWEKLVPFLDAANIDIKSFNDEFYKKYCKGKLAPVLRSVETMVKMKKHVEITTLLIPGENDSDEEIRKLAGWLAGLNTEIPLHFSRYFPNYKMNIQTTGIETLRRAYKIAKEKLKFVHLGNVSNSELS
ncbi:MAG: AmmeMemoRadiSam system radical SAM enzyme [Elusimicrobia bacterium]|nr:AmmeMemoRadiSam system radical SAM enzyme [Candidatus Liberimonas magnetica]